MAANECYRNICKCHFNNKTICFRLQFLYMKHLSPLVNQTTKQPNPLSHQGFKRMENTLMKMCLSAAKKYFSSLYFFSFSINKRISSKKTSTDFSLFCSPTPLILKISSSVLGSIALMFDQKLQQMRNALLFR